MRTDVEIARAVADRHLLTMTRGEMLVAHQLGILRESQEASAALAREWLAKRDRPPGFDPKLVAPPKAKSNPAHYQRDGVEPIELIESCGLDFLLGNVVKYVARAGQKPGESREADLEKAASYLHRARTGRWPWEAES